MAESFLFSIAESLIAKLASRAYEEASQVFGVYEDLQEFKQTLSFVKSVLLDAEQKQEQNNELREWLKQIKHVFYDAENVLDEVECEALRKQVVKAYGTAKTKVGRFFSSSNPVVFRYKLAQRIKEIKKRLDRVAADRNKFGLVTIDVDRRVVHRREMTYSHVVHSDVIGRKRDKKKIIKLLTQHNPANGDDGSLSVIPIVGMGGLGKTTLAKFVFNDNSITESFPLKMWVYVSEDFDVRKLIIKTINCADEFAVGDAGAGLQNLRELNMEQLANHLKRKLVGQRFLLVLDDVWNEDRVKWLELRGLLSVGAEGSKILVTTRTRTVASMMGTTSSHILEGLSLEDSLSLFVKWAFKEGEEEKYPNLVMIGREIVKKCGGVPLAARTLGSLLFGKLGTDMWESLRDNGIWNLPQKEGDILPALKLSYDQMPSYLRQCFALFSLFPKDYDFYSFRVSSLWAALGLLPSPSENKTLQDVANQYMYELMSRSFLQDFFNGGTYYAFTIHDLVHDLALFVAKDECLVVNSNIQNISESVKHLSFVENNNVLGKSSASKPAGLRTIFCPIKGVGVDNEALNIWSPMYKYLRILDLGYSAYETLPRSIGKLKHLRYLSLRGNKKIKRLPNSICMLQNLQFLSVLLCTELETLPKELRNLISLRTLEVTTNGSVFPEIDIANLSCLEELRIHGCGNLESLFVGMKLPTLRMLEVVNCESLKSLPLDVNHFPRLETVMVRRCANLEWSEEQEDKNSLLRLKCVILGNLTKLVTLPHWLQGSTNTLESLLIRDWFNLEAFPEWFSNLSFLKAFGIARCPKLMYLPNDIHCLPALAHLWITGCPELSRKCQPQVGEYWPKISHIKQILINGEKINFG